MLRPKYSSFFKRNVDLIFGVILIVTHAIIWFLPAYSLGEAKVHSYKFLSLFPMWFVYSAFGSFSVVITLIVLFILLRRLS